MNPAVLLLLGALALQDTAAVRVVFLDVGQADATIIISPEGRAALVDGGRSAWWPLQALELLGVDTLDLMVATHADVDHIGGLDGVLVEWPVRYYLDNGVPHTSQAYRELMDVVNWSGVRYLQAVARTITLASVTLRVLPPPANARDQNNASVGLLIEYGAFRVLLPGDAERDELSHFLKLGVPAVSVLKASHHGALNGVNPGWIQATRPRMVAISVGVDNAYGHPDPLALRYYARYAEAIYRTDRDSDILVEGRRDGSFTVTTWDWDGEPVTQDFAGTNRQ